MCVYVYVCVCVLLCSCVFVCDMCSCACDLCFCVCSCVYLCVYTHTHEHTCRHTHTHTHTHTLTHSHTYGKFVRGLCSKTSFTTQQCTDGGMMTMIEATQAQGPDFTQEVCDQKAQRWDSDFLAADFTAMNTDGTLQRASV